MSEWQPIETAPKDGTPFWATNGVLLGPGFYYRHEEPETVLNTDKWTAYYKAIRAPFRKGIGPDFLENYRKETEAWEKAKADAPPFEYVPNPKAGQVTEHYYAEACMTYDGTINEPDEDGRSTFIPTYWMPRPYPPKDTPLDPATSDKVIEAAAEAKLAKAKAALEPLVSYVDALSPGIDAVVGHGFHYHLTQAAKIYKEISE